MSMGKPYKNVFEAIEDDPVVAENMRLRAKCWSICCHTQVFMWSWLQIKQLKQVRRKKSYKQSIKDPGSFSL
jgi:hypothetical protein